MLDADRNAVLEESLEQLYYCRSRIGSLPAQPPTLRGRFGMMAIKAVRRLLFWFIPQVDAFCAASIALAEHQVAALTKSAASGPAGIFRWRLTQRLAAAPEQPVSEIERGLAALSARMDALEAGSVRRPVLAAGNIVATEVEGFILGIPAEEWRLAAYYAFRGLLEPGLIRYLESILKPGAVFADAGANIGIVTLFAARLAGDSGKVYSFEPAPRTFAILKDNIQVNGFLESGRIDFRQLALADKSGEMPFCVYPANSGHNTLFPGTTPGETIQVRTAALDEVIPAGSRLDAVKVDAEGAEHLIWRGMQRLLADNPGIHVILEYDPAHLRRAGVDPGGFLDEIAAGGFTISRIQEPGGEPLPVSKEELLAGSTVNVVVRRSASR